LYMVIVINISVLLPIMFWRNRKPEPGTSSGFVVMALYLVVFCSSTPLTGKNCARRVGIGMSTAKSPLSSSTADCLIRLALCVRLSTRPTGAGPKCCVAEVAMSCSSS
jgi:hypothetical protein